MIVNDLVTKFSFKGSLGPLEKHNKNLAGSIKLMGGMLVGLNALSGAFSYWANSQLQGIDALGALSKETRVAIGDIQALSYAATQSQSTAEAMESTIKSLTKTIGTAALKGSDDFARLGISVRKSNGEVKRADEILDDVRHRFKEMGLSMAEQESFASALGIDSSLIQLLGKTDAELSSLTGRARELGVLNKEQAKQAEDYNKSLATLKYSMSAIGQLIAVSVGPQMRSMADSFAELLANNKDWIVNGIKFAITWIGNITAAFNRLLPLLAGVAAGWALMQIPMLIALAPIIAITAAVIGLLLIIDDLIVAFQGGGSVIADFFKNTFNIDIVESIKAIFNSFKALYDLILKGGALFASALGFGGGDMNLTAGAGSAGSKIDNRQVTQTNEIKVYTNDAQAAGNAIDSSLQKQLSNANTQLAVGGR